MIVFNNKNFGLLDGGGVKRAGIVCFLIVMAGCSREEVRKEYYPSGTLKSEMRYKHGKLNGITRGYYASGKLKAEAVFQEDKLVSASCYDETGNKIDCPPFNVRSEDENESPS